MSKKSEHLDYLNRKHREEMKASGYKVFAQKFSEHDVHKVWAMSLEDAKQGKSHPYNVYSEN